MNTTTTKHLFLSGVIAALLVLLFHLHGNSADVHFFGSSLFKWAIMRWDDLGGTFAYSYFILPVSIALVFRQRKDMLAAETSLAPRALFVIIGALILHAVSIRTLLPRLSMVSLIVLLWSIPWYLTGPRVARLLLFPCGYLFFCIPLTFLDSLTFPMRLFAASAATSLLNGIGIEVKLIGTAIHSLSNNSFALDVADPCSGLRYFLVLLALSALYANLTQKTLKNKFLLFACSPLIAIAANIIRILCIAIAARFFGTEVATGVYHDFSGYIVFITAVLLLIGTSKLINADIKQILNSWKKQHTNNTV